jgi:predicted transcriptional regulator
MDRPKNWVIEDALKQYLSEQAWQIEGIKQAQTSLKENGGIEFDTVIKKLRSKIKRKQKKFMKIIISQEAKQSLIEIFDYILEDNPIQEINHLSEHPH